MQKSLIKGFLFVFQKVKSLCDYEIEISIGKPPSENQLTLTVYGEDLNHLENLCIQVGLDSVGEMISWSTAVLNWAAEKTLSGEEIGSLSPDGEFTRLKAKILEPLKPIVLDRTIKKERKKSLPRLQ